MSREQQQQQQQWAYDGCIFTLDDRFYLHTHPLLRKQLGPIVFKWLFEKSRCVWCGELVFLPSVSEKVIVCCNGHPACDRCWVNHHDPKRYDNKGRWHTRCRTCDAMYSKYPSRWKHNGLEPLRESMEKIPVQECMNTQREDLPQNTEKCGHCASWNDLPSEKRNLWHWITQHVLYECDCDRLKCSKCYQIMVRPRARTHFTSECRHRPVTCPDCSNTCQAWELTSDNWNSHRSTCPAKREPCIFRGNGCNEMIRQSDTQSHQNSCPFRWEGQCPGCKINVMIGKMTEHVAQCPRCHKIPCPVAAKWERHSEKLEPECRACPMYRLADHMCDPKIRPLHEKIMLLSD